MDKTLKAGYICSYTPVEILIAAGYEPVRIIGRAEERSTSHAHIFPNICPYVHSIFEERIRGTFEDLDIVVFINSCDAMRRLYDIWKLEFPAQRTYLIDVPQKRGGQAIEYLSTEISNLYHDLGGKNPSDIEASVREMNELRQRVTALYHSGKINPADDFEKMVETQRKGITKLKDLITKMEGREVIGSYTESIPLIISGSSISIGLLLRIIKDAGGRIVVDDFCETYRNFENEIAVSVSGDIFKNIASRYLNITCARMREGEDLSERIMELASNFKVKGIIYHTLKFCDQYRYHLVPLDRLVKASGLRLIHLETENSRDNIGQIRSRVEAFIEILKEVELSSLRSQLE